MWPHPSHRQALQPVFAVLGLLVLIQITSAFYVMPGFAEGIRDWLSIHTLLEAIAIIISVMVFAAGWGTNDTERPLSLVFLACVFLVAGVMDFLHVITYPGLPNLLTDNNTEKTINFWLLGRYVIAIGLLAFVLFNWKQKYSRATKLHVLLAAVTVAGLLAWIGLAYYKWLPHTYVNGHGLTTFKIVAEYLCSLVYAIVAIYLLQHMRKPQLYDVTGLFAATCIMAMSEIFFTWYHFFSDFYSLLGHIYKVIAYAFLYKSIFIGSIRMPYQRLTESRNLLQTVVDTIPMRIFWKDNESRFLGCNIAFAKDVGRESPQEVVGKTESDLAPKNRAAAFRREDVEVMQTGVPKVSMRTSHKTDGREIWLRTSKIPLLNTNRDAVGVLGIYDDITEQVKLDEKLYLYQSLIEYSADPVVILDPMRNFLLMYANEAACQHFSVPPEALIGSHIWQWDPNYNENVMDKLWANLRNTKKVLIQSTHRKATGESIPVELSAFYLRHEEEELIALFFRDITERKKNEESIRLAALVYQSSSEAMAVTDPDGNIVDINPSFTQVTGYTREEVIGKNANILSSGRHDDAFYQAMWKSINETGTWHGEIWNKRKNGEIYAEWLTINTIFDDEGKPFRRVELFSDITKRKEAELIMWQQANFDSITGLPNRNMFIDRLEQKIKKSNRTGEPLAVMFLDLDHFKDVNDTLGHTMGDLLLKETAKRITSCVRETDTVARLGGDEFTIILSELEDTHSLERICQDLLHKLSQPFQLGENVVYVSASIGLTFYPEDAQDIDQLLKNADQAMYAAKSEGRNRYNYFTASMQLAAQVKMRMVSDLRTALADNQFLLHYQPIIDLATGSINKAEALIRWQHPTHGIVNPAQFISVAEETGLINEIGDWVFREAARQCLEWRQKYDADFQVSINKSPVQFQTGGTTPSNWADHLVEIGMSGRGLVVEITEGLLLDASPGVSNQLLELREAGIQVAIDDFGTGYSSLAYLKRFDIDYVKIDRSFIRSMEKNQSDVALCEAIIMMAHKLGMKVIAEGVETREQHDLLIKAGCDYGQGFLFSRPVVTKEFEKLLKKPG